jgi:hypothetical protein
MALNKDILLGPDGDLQIVGGDFVLGEALEQQIEHLFLADKGAYKDSPLVGVGIRSLLNGRLKGPQEIVRECKLQLQSDGWQQIDLEVSEGFRVNVHAVR